MRRRSVHWMFGAVALVCALGVAYEAIHLNQSRRVNAAIAGAGVSSFDPDIPAARFARAVALAQAGESEAAIKTYKELTLGDDEDLQQRARYNLGNLYMREALANGAQQAFRSLPLIELAKQSYRELLRADPYDWDARYNLERALWIAPESDQAVTEEEEPPGREQSMSTVQGARIDLP